MAEFAAFECPRCHQRVETLPAAEPIHECPRNGNRPTVFKPCPTTGEDPAMPSPKTTASHIRKGTAPRQAAKQADKVAESKAKLDALKASQDTAGELASESVAKAAANPKQNPKPPKAPSLVYAIDGKPVTAVHSSLAGISRASGLKGGERMTTSALRDAMKAAGVEDPDHGEFSFTLPNGVVLTAKKGTPPATKKRAPKAEQPEAKAS